jgi:hypothetical protein
MEVVAHTLKTRVGVLIRENYNYYFKEWIADSWHAGFPTLYVDILFGTLDKERTLRGRLGDRLYDDLQKKIETMGEHISHGVCAFMYAVPTYEEEDVYRFVYRLIDSQLEDADFSMFFEEVTTSPPAPV